MTNYEMLVKLFRTDLVDKYKQYEIYLNGPTRIVKAKKTYKPRGFAWYEKDDLMLAFGQPEIRNTWNKRTRKFDIQRVYITIYSGIEKSLCLAPIEHLEVLEVVK